MRFEFVGIPIGWNFFTISTEIVKKRWNPDRDNADATGEIKGLAAPPTSVGVNVFAKAFGVALCAALRQRAAHVESRGTVLTCYQTKFHPLIGSFVKNACP
jgi:hypothetical protein